VKPGANNPAEKRRKEVLRQKWQREKAERRQQRQVERQQRGEGAPDEDPDLIGIVPGPQLPPPDEESGGVAEPSVEAPSSTGTVQNR
jgi:hypothetical protein